MAENELNFLFAAGSTPTTNQQPKLNSAKGKGDPISLLVQEFRNTLTQLSQLWDQIHLDENARSFRVEQVCEYVNNLLKDIVGTEEKSVRGVASNLEVRREAVAELRALFRQGPFDETCYPKGSIALLKALDAEMNRLGEKRETMMTKQREYYEKYGLLCQRLGHHPEEIEGVHERIFTEPELTTLRNKVADLKNNFNKRLDRASQLQSEAKKIFDTVQLPTNNSFGEEDVQCLKMNLQKATIVLSDELLNKLSMLNQRLKDHYDAWIEQVAFRYDELLVKLDELSAKCFRPPVSNEYPEKFNPAQLTEKELAKLEEQLQAREEIFRRAEPVFDKLNEWMTAWKEKLDTERRVCRASFYKNRAGSLTTKLKQRKMLDQKVPRLFNELHALCDEYVKNYPVYDILVEGMRADKYANHVLKSYEQDREFQKAQKQISTSRVAQTPGPGRNRNVYATNTPSRHAMRKLIPNTPATVAGTTITGRRKRSFSCSQLSAIHPLASPMSGPRTSSPKPEWS